MHRWPTTPEGYLPVNVTQSAQATPAAVHRRRRRVVRVVVAAVLAVLVAATALMFVWPPQGMPARVDAIIVLDGPGARYQVGEKLAEEHRAPYLVVSTPTPIAHIGVTGCIPPIRGVKVICFNPNPQTTQGEARYAGELVRHYHWKTIALVAVSSQNLRARLRFGACISTASISVVDAPFQLSLWPNQIMYGWGAMIKDFIFDRGC
jgi:hypothetical protein